MLKRTISNVKSETLSFLTLLLFFFYVFTYKILTGLIFLSYRSALNRFYKLYCVFFSNIFSAAKIRMNIVMLIITWSYGSNYFSLKI